MSNADWHEFTFRLRLHLPKQDFEAELLILARDAAHVREIGAVLAYLYRAALSD